MTKVSDILADPDHWCQHYPALDKAGLSCPLAIGYRFCLMGAIMRAYPLEDQRPICARLLKAIHHLTGTQQSIPDFNDGATHAQVLEAAKLAGI